MTSVDVTTLKDRRDYYLARVEFLKSLLAGDLTGKQRREAERELFVAEVKAKVRDGKAS